jgi:serine/threonine protein kinase
MRPTEVTLMRREIEIHKVCQDPSVVKMLDIFETSTHYQIVMELMQGDLYDYLEKRNFKLSESHVKKIIFKIIEGVKYLHSFGIVHRDLKVENIMMSDDTDDAYPKIADFGLSKILGPGETTNDPFGTVGYSSPQVIKMEQYGFSCDSWSIGCMIYALLAGALPFMAK